MSSNFKLNDSQQVLTGRVFNIHRDDITLENGTRIKTEVIRHPGAAAIIALTGSGEILLLKQYRYAVDSFIWEIPAGTMSGQEAPLECARRELEEETGYKALKWQEMGEITPLPGYSDERIHLFLARDLKKTTQNLDADEMLSVHIVPYQEVIKRVADGEIRDAKTLSALFLATRLI